MKSSILLTAFLFVFSFTSVEAQSTEVLKTDSGNHNITISDVSMYGDSESETAKKYFSMASNYSDKNDLENAKKYYLKAIDEDPKYVEAYDNLGVVYRKLKEYDKAIESYKKSIALYPNGATAHQNLAAAYGITNDYENALKEYEILVSLNPEDPEGYFGLANTNMILSQFDEAIVNAEKAMKLYEKANSPLLSDSQYLLGLIYYYKGDDSNAKKYLKLAKKNGAHIDPKLEKEFKL